MPLVWKVTAPYVVDGLQSAAGALSVDDGRHGGSQLFPNALSADGALSESAGKHERGSSRGRVQTARTSEGADGQEPRLLPAQAELRAAFGLFADPAGAGVPRSDLDLVLTSVGVHLSERECDERLGDLGLSSAMELRLDDVRALLVHLHSRPLATAS